MRKVIWTLLALAGLLTLAAPPAMAGATCQLVPSWCPPAPPGSGGGKAPVPEPATLAVLGAGAAAALAARRRKK
jgi:PEP-CTERM motif